MGIEPPVLRGSVVTSSDLFRVAYLFEDFARYQMGAGQEVVDGGLELRGTLEGARGG